MSYQRRIDGQAHQFFFWYGTDFKIRHMTCEGCMLRVYSCCHTKRRIGSTPLANPAFGMTTTKIFKDMYLQYTTHIYELLTPFYLYVILDDLLSMFQEIQINLFILLAYSIFSSFLNSKVNLQSLAPNKPWHITEATEARFEVRRFNWKVFSFQFNFFLIK